MFDKYLIVDDSLRNTGPSTAPTGFEFSAKLGYYRGLGLSMIEDLAITIDGNSIPRSAILFNEGPGALTLDQMETAFDRRWAFGTPAQIKVDLPGGLSSGNHVLSITQLLRVSYLPFPALNTDSKSLEVK